jgi:hypothetical protein
MTHLSLISLREIRRSSSLANSRVIFKFFFMKGNFIF